MPGAALGEGIETADWQAVFSAMACYRVTSLTQQRDLAAAAAALAAETGFPLLVDLRPGLVVIDSGKDQSDDDAHGLDPDFTDLAANLQTARARRGPIRLREIGLQSPHISTSHSVPDRRHSRPAVYSTSICSSAGSLFYTETRCIARLSSHSQDTLGSGCRDDDPAADSQGPKMS